MTRRRRHRSKRWLYPVLVIALVAVAGAVGYKVWKEYFQEDWPSKDQEMSYPSGQAEELEQTGQTEVAQEDVVEGGSDAPEGTEETVSQEPEGVSGYEGGNPNVGSGITGVVTYAGVNNGVLMIRVNIDQYLAGGNCTLSLLKDGALLHSEEVGVVDAVATSTCEGFNVPVANLGNESGVISIRIKVTTGEKSGIIEGEVNL